MAKLSLDLADLISRIEQAEERWLELSELTP
jgi:ATP-binding cassette subfamily F protein uup